MVTESKKIASSIDDLAYECGISRAHLYNLANEGKLPGARRLGRRIVVHRPTFEAWLAAGMGDNEDSDA